MHRSKLWPPSELEGCWACRTQTQWEGRRKPSRENHPVCQTWFFFTRKTTKSSQTSIWKYLFGSLLKMSAMWTQLPLAAMAPRELLLKSRFDFQGKSHKGWEGSAFFFFTENLPQGGKKKSQQPEKASWKCEQLGQFLRKHGWCWQEMLGGMQDWLHILPWSRTEQRDQCEKPLLGSTFPFDFG